jgi:ketosteroid isomerase-like protein
MNDEAAVAEIRALEDRRYRAMIAKDVAALDALLHDDLLYTHSTAATDGKPRYLENIRQAKSDYRKIERPEESIRVYGGTAIVTGRVRIEVLVEGAPRQLNSRFTDVWLNGPGGWRMVIWQSTPIPRQ